MRSREAKMEFRIQTHHPEYTGLDKVLIQTGDFKGASADCQRVQEIIPLPDYGAALFDLYKKTGQYAQPTKQILE
jgi:hypothetical protein